MHTYAYSTRTFLRLLAIVYLCAFCSVGVQMRGLYGHDGILPVADLINAASEWVASNHLSSGFLALPTVFWFGSSDAALIGACIAGATASVLLLFGIAPVGLLAILWMLYMSIVNAGRDFMAFQWDALLVETGFLAIFLAPLTWRDRGAPAEPRAAARWLMWWLLFRLMLGSGVVKLASGDPTWRNLTALALHYETQPLPTPLGWYAWLLPMWFHKISTGAMFMIELICPWLIVGPRSARVVACAAFVGLQLLIAATGNYTFFNLLTIALCVTLLDDAQTPWRWRALRSGGGDIVSSPRAAPRRWPIAAIAAVGFATVPASLVIVAAQAGLALPGKSLVEPIYTLVAPFRIVNSYGLFAVMTTTRPELTIEGTADGVEWKPYVFKYKPSPARPNLAWVAPHQPRLDWQMWFAALGDYETEPWFRAFRARLLEGSPAVTSLLAVNPFPDHPPMRLRVTRQVYRFATPRERRENGSSWSWTP